GATIATSGGPGDLDGDGFDEFLATFMDASEWFYGLPLLFYGAPDLLAGPLDAARAAASFEPGVGALLALGDIDGDGDAELGALRPVNNARRNTLSGWDIAVLSGTRARLSGDISVGPEPTLAGSQLYPDMPDRYAQQAVAAGDLDGDGARDVLTLSLTLFDTLAFYDPYPMLHIHYGNHVESSAPEDPR
ncbi:MAG TPA: hypothetical protein VNN80_32880, partial [Polyangiaceae bacterium]|nr:hypothetical protein [Polyangiaceae bacterium]